VCIFNFPRKNIPIDLGLFTSRICSAYVSIQLRFIHCHTYPNTWPYYLGNIEVKTCRFEYKKEKVIIIIYSVGAISRPEKNHGVMVFWLSENC